MTDSDSRDLENHSSESHSFDKKAPGSEPAMPIDAVLAGQWAVCKSLLEHSYPYQQNQTVVETAETSDQILDLPALAAWQAFLQDQPLATEHSLLQHLLDHNDNGLSIDQTGYALLKFTEQYFANYIKNCRLDTQLAEHIKHFRSAAMISLLNRQLPWQNPTFPLSAIQLIYQHSLGWQANHGRAAERFSKALCTHIVACAYASEEPQRDQAMAELNDFFATESKRISKLEQRLRDAEIGALHAKHAQQLSARTLNQQMSGKKLPAAISAFLQNSWRESMRLLILNEGQESAAWKRMVRLTETLIWTLQPYDSSDTTLQQHVYDSISELSEQLSSVAIGLHHSDLLGTELAVIENEHVKVLTGKALRYMPFELIENTDPLVNTQATVSSHLIKKVDALEEGLWFIQHDNEQQNRIKLTIKIPQAQQLLFTNFMGIKAAQFNYEEFAYQLSSNLVVPINARDIFKITGEKILTSLHQRIATQRQLNAEQQVRQDEALLQQQLTEQATKEKALAEAREFTRIQQQQRLEAEQEQQRQQAQKLQQQRAEEFSRDVENLQLGGRVLFKAEEREDQLCRLAAILQSSGDYIFVDRAGIKQYALSKQQIAQKLLDDSASIVDQGSNFENTLEKVVDNLRKRKPK